MIRSDVTASPLNEGRELEHNDIFEKQNLVSGSQGDSQDVNDMDISPTIPEGFDELPIELVSLIDR